MLRATLLIETLLRATLLMLRGALTGLALYPCTVSPQLPRPVVEIAPTAFAFKRWPKTSSPRRCATKRLPPPVSVCPRVSFSGTRRCGAMPGRSRRKRRRERHGLPSWSRYRTQVPTLPFDGKEQRGAERQTQGK